MEKIILFGDSITAGFYNQEITSLLTDRVQQAFPEFEVINAGVPGNTTVDGLKRMEENVLKYNPKYVVVYFGVNDLATHFIVRRKDYENNLQQMLDEIGTEKIILVSSSYVNQRIRLLDRPLPRIERYVETAKKVASKNKVPFINLLEAMLQTGDERSLLQEDGLHFSEKGYDLLSKLMNEELRKKIESE